MNGCDAAADSIVTRWGIIGARSVKGSAGRLFVFIIAELSFSSGCFSSLLVTSGAWRLLLEHTLHVMMCRR